MPRTDAHTPYRVRLAGREVDLRAVHNCPGPRLRPFPPSPSMRLATACA